MEHGEVTHAKGFGHNTNGVGILIVVIVAVCLVLFCWNFWKDGSREADHYRLNSETTQTAGHEGHGEMQGAAEASGTATGTEPSAAHEALKVDSASQTVPAADSSKPADSTHH